MRLFTLSQHRARGFDDDHCGFGVGVGIGISIGVSVGVGVGVGVGGGVTACASSLVHSGTRDAAEAAPLSSCSAPTCPSHPLRTRDAEARRAAARGHHPPVDGVARMRMPGNFPSERHTSRARVWGHPRSSIHVHDVATFCERAGLVDVWHGRYFSTARDSEF